MFYFTVRQSPIKAFNVMLYNGRMMSISYRIEAQLNKEVSKITLRKASLFFGGGGGTRETQSVCLKRPSY